MKKTALLGPAVLCGFASTAFAEPCVSETFERPLPEATSVVSYISDVPSALFPAFWQEGILEGFRYKILASSEGTVGPIDIREDWAISITCNTADLTCNLSIDGEPPQTAVTVSDRIGQCLLGLEITVEEIIDQTSDSQSAESSIEETLQDISLSEEPICGSASISEINEVAVMQRLLIMAGEDPGPVDGILGPLTFAGMEPFVAGADRNTPIPDVIALLDAQLCAAAN